MFWSRLVKRGVLLNITATPKLLNYKEEIKNSGKHEHDLFLLKDFFLMVHYNICNQCTSKVVALFVGRQPEQLLCHLRVIYVHPGVMLMLFPVTHKPVIGAVSCWRIDVSNM